MCSAVWGVSGHEGHESGMCLKELSIEHLPERSWESMTRVCLGSEISSLSTGGGCVPSSLLGGMLSNACLSVGCECV